VRRSSIEYFLHKRDIAFVPDTSADEPQYLRNTIRHELLPLLARQYNPRVVEALCTTADLARDDEELLRDATAHAADAALKLENYSVRIPISLLERHPLLGGRIVRRALELLRGSCRSLTYAHTNAVLALVGCHGSDKMITIPGGLVVRREYNALVMCPPHIPTAFHVQVDQLPVDIRLPQINARVQIRKLPFTEEAVLLHPAISDTVYLAVDSLRLPITIRSWNPGDRIHPFGFKTGKKVKAVFAEKKIPVRLRGNIPLIESEGRIVSVGTLRMAEHCRVTPPCREVIAVTITNTNAT
jgi:tRNA(Ile)-lysidine synthase